MKIGEYAKTLVALLVTAVTALQGYLDDLVVTPDEWKALGGLVLATVAVWLFPNFGKPTSPPAPPFPSVPGQVHELPADTVTMGPLPEARRGTQEWQ